MAQNKLILRKLQSPYLGQFTDSTKGSVLTHSELDGNQIFIKGELIYTATTNGTALVFPQIKGTDIQVDIDDLISDSASSTISGTSFDTGSFILTIDRNDGTSYTENLSALASDMFVLNGVYNSTGGTLDFTTNSGDTFSISGFSTGMTNYYSIGGSFNEDTIYVDRTDTLSAFTIDLSPMGQTGSSLVPLIYNQSIDIPNNSIQPAFGSSTIATGATYSNILGGSGNTITSDTTYSNIVGGSGNTINGGLFFSNIVGGQGNTNSGDWGNIFGGKNNSTGSLQNTIIGGSGNDARFGANNILLGGQGNTITQFKSAIVGGTNNTVLTSISTEANSVIAGGEDNQIDSEASFIAGGNNNSIASNSDYSAIVGGKWNQINGAVNGIFGGEFNSIVSTRSVILGGQNNSITGITDVFIVGSNITANTVNTTYVNNLNIYDTPVSSETISTLLVRDADGTVNIREVNSLFGTGLYAVSASTPYQFTTGTTLGSIQPSDLRGVWNDGRWSTVSGGKSNIIGKSGDYSFIGAGDGNTIYGADDSFIGAGRGNTILGNANTSSVIGGGSGNTINAGSFQGILLGVENFIGGDGFLVDYGVSAVNAQIPHKGWPNQAIFSGAGFSADRAFIVGGANNSIDGVSSYAFIVGGQANRIDYFGTADTTWDGQGDQNTPPSSIIGGTNNWIHGWGGGLIGGGYGNIIMSAIGATIITSDVSFGGDLVLTGPSFMDEHHTLGNLGSEYRTGGNLISKLGGFSMICHGNNNEIRYGYGNTIIGGSAGFIGSPRLDYSLSNFPIIATFFDTNYSTLKLKDEHSTNYNLVGGGVNNIVMNGDRTSIIGGENNYTLRSYNGFVGGGGNNTIFWSADSNIVGGGNNVIAGTYNSNLNTNSSIVGGNFNKILGGTGVTYNNGASYSFVGGGNNNIINDSRNSNIVGGENNKISGVTESAFNFIGGGGGNINAGRSSIIVGGSGNTITNFNGFGLYGYGIGGTNLSSVIVGGSGNKLLPYSKHGFIGSGSGNTIFNEGGVIVGGYGNYNEGKYGGIVSGRYNKIKSVSNYSFIGAGRSNYINSSKYSGILGGKNNEIVGSNTSYSNGIVGGEFNIITSGKDSSIGGGVNNYINLSSGGTSTSGVLAGPLFTSYITNERVVGGNSAISSGIDNRIIDSSNSIIGGGSGNTIIQESQMLTYGIPYWFANYYNGVTGFTNDNNVIGGGSFNEVKSSFVGNNVIVGGGGYYIWGGQHGNLIEYNDTSFIGGGHNNKIIGYHYQNGNYTYLYTANNVIVGGYNNSVLSAQSSTIVGGQGNTINYQNYSFIGGGTNNDVSGSRAVIGGGQGNIASGNTSFIGGGSRIINGGNKAVVVGGYKNVSTSSYSTIGGGLGNEIDTSQGSVIGGGGLNDISNSIYSFIGAGKDNILERTQVNFVESSVIVGLGAYTVYITHNLNRIITSGEISVTDGVTTVPINQINTIYTGVTFTSVAYVDENTSAIFLNGGIGGETLNAIIFISNNLTPRYNILGGGKLNSIGSARYSSILGGTGNTITSSVSSSILGGSGNTINGLDVGINNAHIIGSNITALSANTTYVETLNVGTVVTGNTVTDVLVRDTDGMVRVKQSTSGLTITTKYVEAVVFSSGIGLTVTHNLGSEDVQVQLKNPAGELVIPGLVNNYSLTGVDIEVSVGGTYRVIIIG